MTKMTEIRPSEMAKADIVLCQPSAQGKSSLSRGYISSETARVRYLRYLLATDCAGLSEISARKVMEATLQLPNGYVSVEEYSAKLRMLQSKYDNPKLAYEIASVYSPVLSGSLGFLIGSQPSGWALLDSLEEFTSNFASFDHVSCIDKDEFVLVKYTDLSRTPDNSLNFEIKSMHLLRVFRELLGPNSLRHVRFGVSDPAYASDLIAETDCEIRFEEGATLFYLTPDVLEENTSGSNEMLASAISFLVSRSNLPTQNRRIEDKIFDILFQDVSCTLQDVASHLGMASRTLQRKLNDQGVTFSTLKEEALKEQAIVLLLCTDMSVLDISLALSFSDLSSFYRAFRQWTSEAPAHFRKKYRSDLEKLREF